MIKTASDASLSDYVPKKALEKANNGKVTLDTKINEVKEWLQKKSAPKRGVRNFLQHPKETTECAETMIKTLKKHIDEAKSDKAA